MKGKLTGPRLRARLRRARGRPRRIEPRLRARLRWARDPPYRRIRKDLPGASIEVSEVQNICRVANGRKLCFIPAVPSRLSDTDWSRNYQDGNTPWDKGFGAPPLKEYLDRNPVTGRVLVPGCGRGHDVRLLAGQGAEVVGQDISTVAVELARAIEPVGNEIYLTGDFLDPDAALGRFDLVFEHTCFCAIFPEERDAYVRAVHNSLEPGGQFLAIFFTNIDSPEGPPFPVTADELNALFWGHFEVVDKWIPTEAYPEREGREEMWLMAK